MQPNTLMHWALRFQRSSATDSTALCSFNVKLLALCDEIIDSVPAAVNAVHLWSVSNYASIHHEHDSIGAALRIKDVRRTKVWDLGILGVAHLSSSCLYSSTVYLQAFNKDAWNSTQTVLKVRAVWSSPLKGAYSVSKWRRRSLCLQATHRHYRLLAVVRALPHNCCLHKDIYLTGIGARLSEMLCQHCPQHHKWMSGTSTRREAPTHCFHTQMHQQIYSQNLHSALA